MIWPTTKSKLKKIKKLQELGNTQAREKLVLLMNKESEVSLKNEAVKALSSIPSKKVVGPLIMALKNDSPQARATAAESLGSHREASAVEPLIQVLQDPDDVVRMRAAEALGKIGDARAVEPLCKMLEDKEWAAHWAAALALGRIGDTRAISPLLVWVEKILSAANRKMSSQEKLNAVRDVLFNIFQKADDQVLHTLAENLIMSVRITSWEITNRQTGESGWVKRTYENPIWSILKYELNERKERRKAAEEAEAAKRQAESGEAPPAG
ncbi:HEAT repeat domain-containing protein, partial [Candidatus Sumerlaeota bacterium]|nr:HEAT repeat domain-containing protein [Candidatus Sumerlaeota bacterium]